MHEAGGGVITRHEQIRDDRIVQSLYRIAVSLEQIAACLDEANRNTVLVATREENATRGDDLPPPGGE